MSEALVSHPLVKAVGFTGSLAGGRALFNLCAARPEPIPFFGEFGSVNPNFVLPKALFTRGDEIANNWAASLVLGAGQFCTNPGMMIIPDGAEGDRFVSSVRTALEQVAPQTMLTDGIASAYRDGQFRLRNKNSITTVLDKPSIGRMSSPSLFETTATQYLADKTLGEEVFGPLGIVVRATSSKEILALARALPGQLTATLHLDEGDHEEALDLMPILERRAGRVLCNGFSTGVEVVDAMVHGGPYPASTNFGATSVGTMSIRRFLCPVSYLNLPQAFVGRLTR